MSFLWQARYFHTAAKSQQLPPEKWPEVVFVGRSNAGKSSAINTLCHQKQLAFASKTPGRTQSINFFSLGGGHPAQHRNDAVDTDKMFGLLVDLPGYGYASVSNRLQSHWSTLLSEYIAERKTIKGLVLLSDSRRPLLPLDLQLLNIFLPQKKPVLLLLTKADKLKNRERQAAQHHVVTALGKEPLSKAVIQYQFFSTLNKEGVQMADDTIRGWISS